MIAQLPSNFLCVTKAPVVLSNNVDIVEGVYLDPEPNEGVSIPIVDCRIQRPIWVVVQVSKVDIIIPFLHDSTNAVNELTAVLATELVFCKVFLGFQDFWVVAPTGENKVVSPRRHLPRS